MRTVKGVRRGHFSTVKFKKSELNQCDESWHVIGIVTKVYGVVGCFQSGTNQTRQYILVRNKHSDNATTSF